jgi:hypothetical protein
MSVEQMADAIENWTAELVRKYNEAAFRYMTSMAAALAAQSPATDDERKKARRILREHEQNMEYRVGGTPNEIRDATLSALGWRLDDE